MDLTMTVDEREAFLVGLHVGVFSVARAEKAPLAVPIWYGYEPGGDLSVVIGEESVKARLLERTGRFSLCAQSEQAPYKYVSVEGPVVSTERATGEEREALAVRYLGEEMGAMYLRETEAESASSLTVRMTPEHWLSTDYTKAFGEAQDRLTANS